MLRSIVKPAVALCLICAIVTAALSFTNMLTKEIIAEGLFEREESAKQVVAQSVDLFEAVEIVSSENNYDMINDLYKSYINSEYAGYVFNVSVKGYAGEIRMMVGIDEKGMITGVKVGNNKETPGLGAKAADDAFISQFTDLTPERELKVTKSNKKSPEDIDAVSGATISSSAVTQGVQAAVDMWNDISKGKVELK